ncbi:hypothetical protein HDZ31DRAFT_69558 [Schizophyllum fasciatum]
MSGRLTGPAIRRVWPRVFWPLTATTIATLAAFLVPPLTYPIPLGTYPYRTRLRRRANAPIAPCKMKQRADRVLQDEATRRERPRDAVSDHLHTSRAALAGAAAVHPPPPQDDAAASLPLLIPTSNVTPRAVHGPFEYPLHRRIRGAGLGTGRSI